MNVFSSPNLNNIKKKKQFYAQACNRNNVINEENQPEEI